MMSNLKFNAENQVTCPFVSSCTVTTLSNLKMPYTAMVLTIALYHSCVEAVVSPVSFISRRHIMFAFCSFLPYFSLIGSCDHAYNSLIFNFHFR